MELAQAVVSGVLVGAIYCLVAVGLSLIWGIMDVVNFAQGEFVMVGMYLTFALSVDLGLDPLESLPIVALAMAVLGVATYHICIRNLKGSRLLMPVLSTFGLALFLQYGIQGLFTADFRSTPFHLIPHYGSVTVAGVSISDTGGIGFLAALVALAALWVAVYHTHLGRSMRAVAQDRDAAITLGIHVTRINQVAWAISGALAGTAGALLTMTYQVSPSVGNRFTLVAFAAVALGGFGSIVGPGIAAMALGVVEIVVGTFWNTAFQTTSIFILLILALTWRATIVVRAGS